MEISLVDKPIEEWLKLTKYPVRVCRWVHECILCDIKIRTGDQYYDGGYGKRAHIKHFIESGIGIK